MVSPLEGPIAKSIYKGFKKLFLRAVLERDTVTDAGPLDQGVTSTATYECKAVDIDYSDFDRGQGLVNANDMQVIILANSLAVTPEPLDRITIFRNGVAGRELTIVSSQGVSPQGGAASIRKDPANATWTVRATG